MRRIEVGIELDATPDAVWEILEPIEHHVDWMADAVAIRFLGERTRGVGTSFVCDTRVGPFTLQDHMTITEWQPGSRMGVDHSGVVSGSGVFVLEPIDLGRRTRFTWREELRFPWHLGGRLGEIFGAPVLRFIWRRNLARLRLVVEERSAQPS